MDLDGCARNGVVASNDLESLVVNVVDHSHHSQLVLHRDSIQWQNIYRPQSLMVTTKKLVSIST